LRLHYVDWGNPSAPPLLLIHGGRDHCRSWDWAAEKLRHQYHVIALDLRGHGDSGHALGSSYALAEFVYDIAHFVQQKQLKPLSILSHSMGGAISLMYAGAYPETIHRLAVIEGIFWSPVEYERRQSAPIAGRITRWVEQLHDLSARQNKRYGSLEEAVKRMRAENPRLTAEQAEHLTVHGMNQNEDGSFSWKFDNYIRALSPFNLPVKDVTSLWSSITCPTLLIRGSESDASDPATDGSLNFFKNARALTIQGAGHWVHHDKLDELLGAVVPFLQS
jgi:pimeloyl-ACP methyl ester carboxylesterase